MSNEGRLEHPILPPVSVPSDLSFQKPVCEFSVKDLCVLNSVAPLQATSSGAQPKQGQSVPTLEGKLAGWTY